MELLRILRALLRHRVFRRLLGVRVVTQLGDGFMQVAMLSYALFSPQHQPDGWAIVAVLAINYLPFSLIAPFVAPLLDHWSRQRCAIITDVIRTILCAAVTWQLLNSSDPAAEPIIVYILLLLVMSLNRFVLAGLAAGLAATVDEDEYLHACALMPMIGPSTLVIAGSIAGAIRIFFDDLLPLHASDAIISGLAALTFAVSVILLTRIERDELGPVRVPITNTSPATPSTLKGVWSNIVDALSYLKTRRVVVQGLIAVAIERTGYGALMTLTILAYRNTFHQVADIGNAIADMGTWFIASGVGFALSGVVAPVVAAKLKVRNSMLAMLALSAIVQLVPGSILLRPALVAAAFANGVCVQCVKVYTDTLTQAHISDTYRGRIFMLYDIINNVALVLGALAVATVAPPAGLNLLAYLAVAFWLLLGALWFARASAQCCVVFDKGSPWVRC
ncbi:MAG: MFS transporter [Propionibacteriaceae bacterium]|jgi:MFS family permease|nr:MFS transporter [Propionibacteriaceae bacterium]